ncbi:FxsA family protein [Bacillaceae bacterium S4-13-58]
MFRWLLLFILVVPACEIGIFVWAGGIIGPWWVIALIILTGILGAYLAKVQGIETLTRARASLSYGQIPQEEIIDGICILVGAVVLLTPGFITDAIGFLLLFPVTRRPIKIWMKQIIRKMLDRGTITIIR